MKHHLSRRAYISDLTPGDVVSVRFNGVLSHYGIVTHRGTILSNSRLHGGVVEQSYEAFAAGKQMRLHPFMRQSDSLATEARARRRRHSDYDLTGSNCAHYVNASLKRRPTSVQYGRAIAETLRDMMRR